MGTFQASSLRRVDGELPAPHPLDGIPACGTTGGGVLLVGSHHVFGVAVHGHLAVLDEDGAGTELGDPGHVVRHQDHGLGRREHRDDALAALFPEHLVTCLEHLVQQQDVGIDRGRDGEAEARPHARAVGLEGCVDEGPDVRELDDVGSDAQHGCVGDAQERARQRDVVEARQLLVEAGLEAEQRRDVAVDLDQALGRRDDAREHQQERALARAVGADDTHRLAPVDGEGCVPQGPEAPVSLLPVEQVREARPQGRLLGEAQVVLDAQVAHGQRGCLVG